MSYFALIFDMDGVIVHNLPYHKKAWKKFCDKYDYNVTEEELNRHFCGTTNKYILTYLFKREATKEEVTQYGQEKEAIYRDIFSTSIQPMPGLISLLQSLKEHKVKMAVATSAIPENASFVLEKLDIKDYFDVILDESSVINHKPHPEIYLTAAKRLDYDSKNCIVFEDSPTGIEAAQKAGATVIGVVSSKTKSDLEKLVKYVIDDFSQINVEKLKNIAHNC